MSTQFSRFGWSKAKNSFAPTALALAVMAGLISGCAAPDASQVGDPTKAVTTAPAEPQKETASPEVTEAAEEEPTQEEPEKATKVEPEVEMTGGQRNALRSAESYLSFSAFSRTGLIEQLEFEDYSGEDATFAADTVDVDWNEQAAKAAENYLSLSSFSRTGLIDQLLFEGYSKDQAEYGVSQTDL